MSETWRFAIQAWWFLTKTSDTPHLYSGAERGKEAKDIFCHFAIATVGKTIVPSPSSPKETATTSNKEGPQQCTKHCGGTQNFNLVPECMEQHYFETKDNILFIFVLKTELNDSQD